MAPVKPTTESSGDNIDIEIVAENSLNLFTEVGDVAKQELAKTRNVSSDVFASVNTLNDREAIHSLIEINAVQTKDLQTLSKEPAIARIVATDDDGNQLVYFISRAAPLGHTRQGAQLVSYRSPMGRLASVPVGSLLTIRKPSGTTDLEVVERALLHPQQERNDWDSINSVLQGFKYNPITVSSLRSLLRRRETEVEGLAVLDQLLAEEQNRAIIVEGIQRSVITKMSLRDQPILDQYQDEIFRCPLASQLLILGPPGSGKTTTLIRRLGQKLDLGALDDDERELLDIDSQDRAFEHAHSWIMFTPTDLLKQYVKEAFAREGVPASDQRIRTWEDFRRELARNTFGILRTGTGTGVFVLKEIPALIEPYTIRDQPQWFEDFYSWQAARRWSDLEAAATRLERSADAEVKALGERLLPILPGPQPASTVGVLIALTALGDRVQEVVSNRSANVDGRIRRGLTLQVNRNRNFLDEFASFLATLSDLGDESEETDPEDEDDEEEEQQVPRPGRQAALTAYMRAIRSFARAEASRRSLGRNSRAARIVTWLGDRIPPREERLAIGENLQILAAARRFANPVRGYMRGFSARYRAFRRTRQADGRWYKSERFSQRDITPLEVDVILLSIFEAAADLMRDRRIVADIETRSYLELNRVREFYKNQVMVDEATDFSPIQLRIMGRLSLPRIESFFACGDFNQRITEWGTRSVDEVKWAFPRIEIKTMTITYRHSRQLNEFAKQVARLSGDSASEAILPEHVNSEGVSPVLGMGLRTEHNIADWLAKRIVEIEKFTQKFPSIAILVNGEDKVQPIASSLDEVLQAQNLRAIACQDGRAIGQENDVRVFDVRHIKGLEFEAVFFIGIDDLAQTNPELFDKFLYVGATRAASYLGLTCAATDLPDKIRVLRSSMIESWAILS